MFLLRNSLEYLRMHVHRSYSAFSEHLTSSFPQGFTNASLCLHLQAKASNNGEKHRAHTNTHTLVLCHCVKSVDPHSGVNTSQLPS